MNSALQTHWLIPQLLESDDFSECFVQRGEAMLGLIGSAMGKQIPGGREAFWAALVSAGFAKPPEVSALSEADLDADDTDDDMEFDELGEAAYDEQLAADD